MDRIEKSVLLPQPRDRVWRAVSDAQQFGSWFGVAFDGPFASGARLTGKIVPTSVDPDIAKLQQPHAGKPFEFFVEQIQPQQRIAFRWHPFAIDPTVDYGSEPKTLIEFELQDKPGGTLLTITESGFDQVPASRREAAYQANDGGWAMQASLIRKFLAGQTAT